MGTLKEDLKLQSEWIVKAFAADGMELDYSIHSLIEIDRFIQKYVKNGIPIKGGRLSKRTGLIIFSLTGYIGETIIKNVPSAKWITNDEEKEAEINVAIEFDNKMQIFPGHKIMKRIQNGLEDGIYPYGLIATKEYLKEKFDDSFWKIEDEVIPFIPNKVWWKFW